MRWAARSSMLCWRPLTARLEDVTKKSSSTRWASSSTKPPQSLRLAIHRSRTTITTRMPICHLHLPSTIPMRIPTCHRQLVIHRITRTFPTPVCLPHKAIRHPTMARSSLRLCLKDTLQTILNSRPPIQPPLHSTRPLGLSHRTRLAIHRAFLQMPPIRLKVARDLLRDQISRRDRAPRRQSPTAMRHLAATRHPTPICRHLALRRISWETCRRATPLTISLTPIRLALQFRQPPPNRTFPTILIRTNLHLPTWDILRTVNLPILPVIHRT